MAARALATRSAPALAGEPLSSGGWGSYSRPSWIIRAASSPASSLASVKAKSMPDVTPPPEERLRFARNESAPPFDPALAPRLNPEDWPAERLAKAHRNYAMEYVRSSLPEVVNLFGRDTALFVAGGAARLVGMQLYHRIAEALGTAGPTDAAGFAAFMARVP